MIKYKNDIYKKIKIRAFEENKGMKQLVTEKFFSAGTLTKIKNNDINISIKTLDALCDFLNCDISDIIEHVRDDADASNGNTIL